jgi:tetratricopeptide (TPR) repeat protein
MTTSRLTILFLITFLISPLACLAQSKSAEKSSAYASQVSRNDNIVSVQELRLSGKGSKAFEQGTRLLDKGDTAGSLAYLDRATAENPMHYKAYYNLGVAHFRLGHLAEAEQAFQKSIDLTGGAYAPPQFGMGVVLCEENDFPHAETIIQRGLDVDPGSANGKFYLGWAQFALNHLVEAERSVQQALLRRANFGEAYFLLARIHLRQRNSPAVVKDLQAYLKLDPHNPGNAQAKALLEMTQREMEQNTNSTAADATR